MMSSKIVYFTNGYMPDREGVSKELASLYSYFSKFDRNNVYLHNIADRWQFSLGRGFISYPDRLLPFGYPFLKYLEKTSDLIHIYGSLTGRIYFKLLKGRPCVLTNASALVTSRLEQCFFAADRIDTIVLESERDLQIANQLGIDPTKLVLIYPGVTRKKISKVSKDQPFTVLFASAPISKNPLSIKRRGVALLIEAAKQLKDCRFIFLWRNTHNEKLNQLIANAVTDNIKVINRIIPDITHQMVDVHCTILTPESVDECKPCPISLIESLACGRPVIVSNRTGISDLIKKENCGIAVEPDVEEVKSGIRRLQDHYESYSKNSLPAAEKYFSLKQFLNSYANVYKKYVTLKG
jgi:glycosyltransferase involved in cell wall biosynthesis